MERLGRGVVAIPMDEHRVYVGWRLLGTDPTNISFNVYRSGTNGIGQKLNQEPITKTTDYVDTSADLENQHSYFVRPILNGVEGSPSIGFKLAAHAPIRPYLSVPLQTPPGYTPNDISVGDLDGDGEYEIVVHQAGRGHDNSQRGPTDPPILEAYKLDGTFLWRIQLGRNIREGAHYTQFMVYDLDGDGRAEIACKTADGTIDGVGHVIGDPAADYRNASGYVLDGPEYLTIFDGKTGAALATTNYIPARGNVSDWGDKYGNRVDRFLACIAYLDGEHPSLVTCRGYYTRTVLVAWNWRQGQLSRVWTFDSDDGTPGNKAFRGQGNHNLAVGDVDGDGCDEIIFGSCAIDHNGKGLYSTGWGHGDALHLSDMDPDRPGLEVFSIHEHPTHSNGVSFFEAGTGKLIWGKPSADVGRGVAMDIDPRHRGYEMWAGGRGLSGLWNVKGEVISERRPKSCNFGVWWDGDLLRELLDGTTISKWNWEGQTETTLLKAEGCASNNSTKATPGLCADIFGDWREEVIWRSQDNRELRIYTTTIPSEHRFYTLMHDPQYRLSVAWQNVGYNQPTQPGFYLGTDMAPPPQPKITTTPTPQKIRVDRPGRRFVDANGQTFVPWGVSYFRPGTGWAPQVWKQFDAEAIRHDFELLKKQGANVVRVFISYGSFYTEPGKLNEEGMAKFEQFLALADEAGLYVHPTGPDAWEGLPAWMHGLDIADDRNFEALAKFWELFASRFRGRSTIWAYDLRNEPAIGWSSQCMADKWKAWQIGHKMEPSPIPDPKKPGTLLGEYQRFRESLGEKWVEVQANAIHKADPDALVTVGLIQWSIPAQGLPLDQYAAFRPSLIAKHLDFMELHFYPLAKGAYRYENAESETANLSVLESMARECAKPGLPLVIAEFGWYGGGALDARGGPATEEQQAEWCSKLVKTTQPMAIGWLNWGMHDHPQAGDVSRLTGLFTTNDQEKAWGRAFQKLGMDFWKAPPKFSMPDRPDLPWDDCTASTEAMTEFQRRYLEAFKAAQK